MQSSSRNLDRLGVAFDDPHLVANARLLLPATLAQHLGLREVVEYHVDLGESPGRAHVGHKALSLVNSMLAVGDSIDDTNVLRAGAIQGVVGHAVLAPSTLGTFLRSFTFGHVRQLDAVSREMLCRAWGGGRGPGDGAITIDMDSTICEVYGLLKQGVGFGYTKVRGLPSSAGHQSRRRRGAPLSTSGWIGLHRQRSRGVPGRDLLPGASSRGEGSASPASGLRLLLQGCAHHLPPGRGALLGHRAHGQGDPAGDGGHPRRGVGADPLLVQLGHLR